MVSISGVPKIQHLALTTLSYTTRALLLVLALVVVPLWQLFVPWPAAAGAPLSLNPVPAWATSGPLLSIVEAVVALALCWLACVRLARADRSGGSDGSDCWPAFFLAASIYAFMEVFLALSI